MRIQHNILAMNSYRNYSNNVSALGKNLERLSSGYKINRAGDDAAGLAISEKMRAQITGLDAAQKNVKDGISLVKTAEGALQEVQDMLNRMVYLATQSANGTYDSTVDRANLQKEVQALQEEIDRISQSANFNGIQLLDGSLNGSSSTVKGADIGEMVTITPLKDARDAEDPQAGKYTVDLSNFEASVKTSGSLTIKVGGVTVAEVTSGALQDLVPSGSSATTVTVNVKNITSDSFVTSVKIGDVSFSVSWDGTKITLTMKTAPTDKFEDGMKVEISGAVTTNQAYPDAVNIVTRAIEKNGKKYAQGSFDLKSAMTGLKDGSQLRIGNDVYTFKVGKDGKATGNNLIDLSDMDADNLSDSDWQEIARRLSEKAESNGWFKVTSDNSSATIYLTERYIGNERPYENDMVGTSTAVDADWNTTNKNVGIVLARFSADGGMVDSSSSAGGLKLQIGDTSDSYNQLSVRIGNMSSKGLAISGIDISTQQGAASAIDVIKNAINSVSATRGDLGAVQNRLEHTQNNLSVMAENIQDAESTIRDTDVADEMMAYVKNNILVQSAQAMLAQANQIPQGVLQLLG